MNILRWPAKMPERDSGRLPEGQDAYSLGKAKVIDPLGACEQTIHVNLFFDGTNNNDDEKNPWRDSKGFAHTNVARLYNVTKERPGEGHFKYYIVGVGTPFPEVDEHTYSSTGKAFATGFGTRCVWGYTRLLHAVHWAISGKFDEIFMGNEIAAKICQQLNPTVTATVFGARPSSPLLEQKLNALAGLQRAMERDCQRNKVIKKVWVNVFGFSRGAASARVFVSKLVNEWAKDGKLAGLIPYQVNFLGLFDTVASVGPPDSTASALDFDTFDGHFDWAGSGRLNVPKSVRRCVHFFSIHEQRMSFPLDTIRKGRSYPGGPDQLLEVPYPGVHSDVGGSYPPGDQGKSVVNDAHKLGKIPLHDMYIEALKAGVPLLLKSEIETNRLLVQDFAIALPVIQAFNAWLDRLPQVDSVEEAMDLGLRQNLMWRSLRARVGTGEYVSTQPFYKACESREGKLTPHQIESRIEAEQANDPETQRMRAELEALKRQFTQLGSRAASMGIGGSGTVAQRQALMKEDALLRASIAAKKAEIQRRKEELYAKIAGKKPEDARPGEGADEIVANDQRDLREAAEEFRLLLGFLHPDQREALGVQTHFVRRPPMPGDVFGTLRGIVGRILAGPIGDAGSLLCVRRDRNPDSAVVTLVQRDLMVSTAAVRSFNAGDDVLVQPTEEMIDYLRKWTSPAAVDRFAIQERAAIALFDDFIHDSRAWFRVPHFHEYSLGGYGWARTLYIGDNTRVRHLGMTKLSTFDAMIGVSRAAVQSARKAALDTAAEAAGRAADAVLDAAKSRGKSLLDDMIPKGPPWPRL
ncbi:phospholipase effector Tle1 domain-containing protein [Cupriavidus basilensis]|uniref:T6SS phospholipase effector Tle1-like catalytic domain-containing protein n=1 Tax=Cupriavidus basilensis TaxID=68895 RepID=UPI0039F732EF